MTTHKTPKTSKRWLIVTAIAIAVLSGFWVWKEVLEDRVIPKRFGVVEQGLIYRSGQLHPPTHS